jgi:hypothetical protein
MYGNGLRSVKDADDLSQIGKNMLDWIAPQGRRVARGNTVPD